MFSTRHWPTSATPCRCLRREAGGWRSPDRRRHSRDWSNFWSLAAAVALKSGNDAITFFDPSVFTPDIDKVAVAPLND
ncbi:hypothetical protein CTU88_27230 [Streptomyces sp. JV178]|uniref:hypothetical protein n=1 Tax=Streptomyces sp. JV178 TaxID=858632 RepID=UPI000C1B0BC7|nr:hypothetical protein [Streptomyces sp. JV178]PIM69668.1 hypothetical protein CTU88_27230 [Streptomyces sp. JV178]